MLWHTVAKSSLLVALSMQPAHVSATRTHQSAAQSQRKADTSDEYVAFTSKAVVYTAEQLTVAVQAGQRYIELREHFTVQHTIFTGQALFLKGACGRAENSPTALHGPIDSEQCTISMGSISQPILAAAFAPVWLSNIVIHSQVASGPQTAAISVVDGMLYMENSALVAEEKASIQSISLRQSKAFITGCKFIGGMAFRGGAIDSLSSSLVLLNSTFQNNKAYGVAEDGKGDGGAVHAAHSHIVIQGSEMLGNQATRAGGALALMAPNIVSISQSTFLGNTASDVGGAIALVDGIGSNRVRLEGSTFMGNTAAMGDDISVSSPNTFAADFRPAAVLAESSQGFQWNLVPLGEAQGRVDEPPQPLLNAAEAWITSAELIFASDSIAPPAVPGTSSCTGDAGHNAAIIVLSCLALALFACLCGVCCRRPLLKSLSKGTPTSYGSPKSSAPPSCAASTNGSDGDARHHKSPNRSPADIKAGIRLPAAHQLRSSRNMPRPASGMHAASADVVVQVIASDRLGWNGLPRQKREQSPTPPSPNGGSRPRSSPWKAVLSLTGSPGSGGNKPVVPKPILPEEEPDACTKRSPRGSARRAPLPPTQPELNTIDEGEEPSSRSMQMLGNTGTTDASGGAGTRSLSLQAPVASPSRSLHNVTEEEYSGSESFGSSEDLDVTPTNSTSAGGFSQERLAYSPGGSLLTPRRGSTFSGTGDRRTLLTDVVPRYPTSTGPPSPERGAPRALLSEPTLKNAATAASPSQLPRQPAAQVAVLRRSAADAVDTSAAQPCSGLAGDGAASFDPMMRSRSFLIQAQSDELTSQPRPLDSGRALDSARSDAWRTLAGERMYGDGLDATSTFGSCSNTFFLVPPKSLSREQSADLAGDGELQDIIHDAGLRLSHGTRLKRMSDELSRHARAAIKGTRSTDVVD